VVPLTAACNPARKNLANKELDSLEEIRIQKNSKIRSFRK
jgi:hypothetical protein